VVAVKGDKVTVAVGAIKTTVSVEELRPTKEAKRPKAKAKPQPRPVKGPSPSRFFGSDAVAVDEGIDNVLDVRGMRADEAVTLLEVFLDRSISDDREVVIVRHGYGSGALRRVIREHLPRLGHVHKHRPGLPGEGGDAVTVVWVSM
jgi:DNA mismatch repair protein MutS2